jgi:hypothetical protein
MFPVSGSSRTSSVRLNGGRYEQSKTVEPDEAFDALKRLYQSKDERLLYLKTHRMLDPLRARVLTRCFGA